MSKRKREDSDSDSSSDSSDSDTSPKQKTKVSQPENPTSANDGDLILHPMFDYLEKWKNDRANWKFNTNKQVCSNIK